MRRRLEFDFHSKFQFPSHHCKKFQFHIVLNFAWSLKLRSFVTRLLHEANTKSQWIGFSQLQISLADQRKSDLQRLISWQTHTNLLSRDSSRNSITIPKFGTFTSKRGLRFHSLEILLNVSDADEWTSVVCGGENDIWVICSLNFYWTKIRAQIAKSGIEMA